MRCGRSVADPPDDPVAAVVVAELRAPRDLVLVPPLREVDRLAETLDGLESRASPRGTHPETAVASS